METLQKIYKNVRRQVINLPATVPSTVDFINKSVTSLRLPPLTRDNVLYYYIPMQGLVSYTTLSVSVMNPHLMVRLFPKRDLTDLLFLTAGGGAGLWLWARPHMAAATPANRFSWAFLGGCLWPLGSIFLWAILRSSVGQRPVIGTILGVSTGAILTNIALDYFRYVELLFCGEVHIPETTPHSPNSDDERYDIDI
ncbi:Conserved insect protein [Operophtera brumata]|uniref:Conserved insect protein n=1 Tax=Operophtera brumata TaxID=104452 RepID=A0A0L7L6R7_OPEBR|nr:Conserved insect protein [Operophtera brumata]